MPSTVLLLRSLFILILLAIGDVSRAMTPYERCKDLLIRSAHILTASMDPLLPRHSENKLIVDAILTRHFPELQSYRPLIQAFHLRRDRVGGHPTIWARNEASFEETRYTFQLHRGSGLIKSRHIAVDFNVRLREDEGQASFFRFQRAFEIWIGQGRAVSRQGPFRDEAGAGYVFLYEGPESRFDLVRLDMGLANFSPREIVFSFESRDSTQAFAAFVSFLDHLIQEGMLPVSDALKLALSSARPRLFISRR